MGEPFIDPATVRTARIFLDRIAHHYPVDHAILFGSRARHAHRSDSDADIAIVIRGEHAERTRVALDMAGIAFEVLLDTGVLVEALPLWEDELEHPERFDNPSLIENIRREGIRL